MKVAIVGSGPTGRAAARELVAGGAHVTVFEKESEAGGLMRWGYPDFRMPIAVTRRDVDALKELGVEFRVNVTLGEDVVLADLERDYDAVLITVGAPRPKRLGIPGEDLAGVHTALEYLHATRDGHPLEIGSDVAVVGGGDTAVDVAVTARNQGADRVTVLYHHGPDQAAVQSHELKRAEDAGVKWEYNVEPTKIEEADTGLLVTVTGASEPQRFSTLVVAIGQEKDSGLLKGLGITVHENGSTNHPKVWLAGGSRYGSDRLAKAIQDGRAVAKRMLDQ
jgi:NADPH-dependent glutamate synthase beta subunit-like oxidoreductase